MAERDPRIDPRPGDVFFRAFNTDQGGVIREIERAHGGFVGYFQDNGGSPRWRIEALAKFQRWARCSEISDLEPVHAKVAAND